MESLKVDLEPKKHVTYYLGDVHEGAINFDEEAFRKAIKMIKEDGDAWIGLGDYIDCINHKDKRFNPLEIAKKYVIDDLSDLPRKQADNFLNAIKPISDKCLCLIHGNHEDNYRRYNSFDAVKYMCDAYNFRNFFDGGFISLNFKQGANHQIPVVIAANHGIGGGGMREGYPVNKVHDIYKWAIADIHMTAHLHNMMKSRAEYVDFNHGKIRKLQTYFCVNGCFLHKSQEGTSNYFEQRPGKESSIGMFKQTIEPHLRSKDEFIITMEEIYL